jgi:hypothetical protein
MRYFLILQNTYSGTASFSAVNSGGDIRLNLGENKNFQVIATNAVPLSNKMVEDKSTWFVTDKEKFRVKTEETVFTAKNLHPAGSANMLMILAENLPKSSDADISVELLSPSKKDLQATLNTTMKLLNAELSRVAGSTMTKNHTIAFGTDSITQGEEFLEAVIHTAKLLAGSTAGKGSDDTKSLLVYRNQVSGTVYWVKWLAAGEVFSSLFKYRITCPEDKPNFVVA